MDTVQRKNYMNKEGHTTEVCFQALDATQMGYRWQFVLKSYPLNIYLE